MYYMYLYMYCTPNKTQRERHRCKDCVASLLCIHGYPPRTHIQSHLDPRDLINHVYMCVVAVYARCAEPFLS